MVILMYLTIFNSIEKLKQDTTCLQYLSKEQKNFILNNKDIILDIIKHNVNIIKYISIYINNILFLL